MAGAERGRPPQLCQVARCQGSLCGGEEQQRAGEGHEDLA